MLSGRIANIALKDEPSMEHHSRFLMGERYKRCWTYSSTDYHHWLMELKRAGYATAKNYVDVCEKIINKYHLDKYDRMAETSNKKTIGFKYNSPNSIVSNIYAYNSSCTHNQTVAKSLNPLPYISYRKSPTLWGFSV